MESKTDKIQLNDSFKLAASVRERVLSLAFERLGVRPLSSLSPSTPARDLQTAVAIIQCDSNRIANEIARICHENPVLCQSFLPMITGESEEFNATVTLWSVLQATLVQYAALVKMKSLMGSDVNNYYPEQVSQINEWLKKTDVTNIHMAYGEAGEA